MNIFTYKLLSNESENTTWNLSNIKKSKHKTFLFFFRLSFVDSLFLRVVLLDLILRCLKDMGAAIVLQFFTSNIFPGLTNVVIRICIQYR